MSKFRMFFLTGFFLLAVFLLSSVPCAYAEIVVSFPPDRIQVTDSEVALVGRVDDASIQNLSVKVQGGRSLTGKTVPVVYGGFRLDVDLAEGMNKITITAPDGSEKVREIFLGDSREGFSRYRYHFDIDLFKECSDCHEVSDRKQDWKRRKMGTNSCRTDECHSDMGRKERYIHGPAAAGVCIPCHNPHGSPRPQILSLTGKDQCLICHLEKEEDFYTKSHLHTPVKSGDCVGCHDPHASELRYQLYDDGAELCLMCHDEQSITGRAVVHAPIAAGECLACHDAHAGSYKNQLFAAGNDVCFDCHEDIRPYLAAAEQHPPVEESCSMCHDAHSAPEQHLLMEMMPDLCLMCHDGVDQEMKDAQVAHSPVHEGKCAECHAPHGSNFQPLLYDSQDKLCATCHEDVGETLEMNPNKHGPVIDGQCTGCHMVHGSANPFILSEYFPTAFYNAYDTDIYTLCFDCHERDIALSATTTTLTNFRDGDQNLHYLHVNHPRKGRSCKACHDVHASDQSKHIRRSVPFGKIYEYPINFETTQSGGSCWNLGCHRNVTYSRNN